MGGRFGGETGSSPRGSGLGYQISLGIKNTRREKWYGSQERMRGLAIERRGKQWAGAEVIYQPNQWGKPRHCDCGPAPSTQHTAPRRIQAASNISRIRIRDKTAETWYSGDASASERQGPWFAKRMGLSVIGILQRQGRQASRFGCRSRLGGCWTGGAPFRRGSSGPASEVRPSGQRTADGAGSK